jgi:GR25 family glycosyltransferase involved in LPS biosynthesis
MNWKHIIEKPAFIIHLSKICPERKEFFMKNIKNAGYKNIQIFEGIDINNSLELNRTLKLFNIIFDKQEYNMPGKIGCTLSHLKLYKHIIDNKIDICTIFEDDIFFHSEWNYLAEKFYQNTPKNFDILFIGNQIEECIEKNNNIPRINQKPCYCTHGYILTLKGAKKLIDLIVKWDYYNQVDFVKRNLNGIITIDEIIKNIQLRILNNKLDKNTLIWYCWNGTRNKCKKITFPLKGINIRNTGLVYQSDIFETTIKSVIN